MLLDCLFYVFIKIVDLIENLATFIPVNGVESDWPYILEFSSIIGLQWKKYYNSYLEDKFYKFTS